MISAKHQRELIEGHYYMGDTFGYDELPAFVGKLVDGRLTCFRPTLANLYGLIEKP